MKIYISLSHDIFFNLALEHWLFIKELKDEKIILLWQNSPSVVIGRAQNPWLECNLKAMKKDKVKIARRQSGGGTVFHDYGNLNYTIFSPKTSHDVKDNLNMICKIVKNIGIDIYPNDRNDIVVDYNDSTYKVSGSAFREKKDRAFHHGTLLINTDTKKLYDYLHQPLDESLDTKGVKSNRSKVLNLSELIPDIQTQDITRSLFSNHSSIELSLINEETPLQNHEILDDEMAKLKNWDWIFGKTLPFYKTYQNDSEILKIKIESGFITELYFNSKVIDLTKKKIKFEQTLSFEYFIKYC